MSYHKDSPRWDHDDEDLEDLEDLSVDWKVTVSFTMGDNQPTNLMHFIRKQRRSLSFRREQVDHIHEIRKQEL